MCELSTKIKKVGPAHVICVGAIRFYFFDSRILRSLPRPRGSRKSKKFFCNRIHWSRSCLSCSRIFDFRHLVALQSKWKFALKFCRAPPGGGHNTCYTSFEPAWRADSEYAWHLVDLTTFGQKIRPDGEKRPLKTTIIIKPYLVVEYGKTRCGVPLNRLWSF